MEPDLLYFIFLYKYLVNEYYTRIIKAYSFIFCKKDGNGKLEIEMPVHVDNVLVKGRPEALDKTKEMIKLMFNIQKSSKVTKLLEYTMSRVVTQTFCTVQSIWKRTLIN